MQEAMQLVTFICSQKNEHNQAHPSLSQVLSINYLIVYELLNMVQILNFQQPDYNNYF